MVNVEKALSLTLGLYKRNPVFFLPHLVESILSFAVLFSMALTLILAIGVHASSLTMDDPYLLMEEILNIGPGLIAIIILTFLFSIFLISIIKAAALSGVVGMAKLGFEGQNVTFGAAIENAKRYALDIFLFWVFIGAILLSLFVAAFLPAILFAMLGLSETFAVAVTLFAFFVALLLLLVLFVAVMFTPQYIVVAGTGIIGSMKNSFDFVKGNIGAVVIYIAVVVVFSFFIFGFFGITSLLPDLFFTSNRFFGASLEIFLTLFQILVSLIIAPYFEMVKTRMIMNTK